jgi:hypothetical protein
VVDNLAVVAEIFVDPEFPSGSIIAGAIFTSDGYLEETPDTISRLWLKCGAPGDYQVRFSQISGSAPNVGAAMDTWHALNNTVNIGMQASSPGQSLRSGVILAEIRSAETGTVLSSGSFSLSATVNFG